MKKVWSAYKKFNPKTKIFFWSPLILDTVGLVLTVVLFFFSKSVPTNGLVYTKNQIGNNSVATDLSTTQVSVANSPGSVVIFGQTGGTTTVISQNLNVEEPKLKLTYSASIFNEKKEDGLYSSVFKITVSGSAPSVKVFVVKSDASVFRCSLALTGTTSFQGGAFSVRSVEAKCISEKPVDDNGNLFYITYPE